MGVNLTIVDQTITAPNLLFDTVWDGFVGDWAPADPTEPGNRGGLRARAALATAILLCLASDARCADSDSPPDGSNDPRGWAGDAVDKTIDPLGSKLWLLRRHVLTAPATLDLAVVYAQSALFTLIKQGAVAYFDVVPSAVVETGTLKLAIGGYKQDGALVVSTNFSILWDQSMAVARPLDATA